MNQTVYTINHIAGLIGGKLILNRADKINIGTLITDSRNISTPETALFFALKGKRHDGHQFVSELYQKGVLNFIVSVNPERLNCPQANFIWVEDTLQALQKLTAWHRSQFQLPVIGVTGSNGKTIVKEWLYQLMRQDKHIVRSPKSYNSQIGVPLSVWQIHSENDLAIFEAGISEPGEMKNLEKIIKPDIGIITNIGQAHDENFNMENPTMQKVGEKLDLFMGCSLIIYCKDYLPIHQALTSELFSGKKLFSWSKKQKADMQIAKIFKGNEETELQCIFNQEFLKIKIPFTDDASIENAIHCWALMLCLDYDNDVIAQRMEVLSPVAMRLELKEGIHNCSIINDTYNSDLGSLGIAIDFILQQKQHDKRTIILSDILQSGRNEESLYQEVANMISQKNIDRIIGIGEAISRQGALFQMEKQFYVSTEDFLKKVNPSIFQNETVLLKGARAFGFERIGKLLQQKAHETVLEINLNALVHNLNYFRSRLSPGKKIMAMVKAFSYGSGSFEIANTLQFHRVDYLAVAYADEGVELRRSGITLPIMVMNPEKQSFESMIQYKLEPEIYGFRVLNHLYETLEKSFGNSEAGVIPVHIKLDTGMHRLGFEEEDMNELIVKIKNNKFIRIESIFSHLAASDEMSHVDFTKKQIELFNRMSDKISSHFSYPILKHILNSAGINRFPEAQLDMVRLGIGLYGVSSDASEQKNLACVGTLKSTISQIRNVSVGETIGYSRNATAKHNMTIATIAIGYADGFSRRLANGRGKVLLNGKLAGVVGNICMDMCMIDITNIPAKEGDEVIIFGADYPIAKLAADMDTIPYEILTTVSQRVKRIYFHE